MHPDEPSHGRAHLAAQVRWVHRDSPNQPLDIHHAGFPIKEKKGTNRGERVMKIKMKSKDDSTLQGLTGLTSNMNNSH